MNAMERSEEDHNCQGCDKPCSGAFCSDCIADQDCPEELYGLNTLDMGNNESLSIGVAGPDHDGEYCALTLSQSKHLKTLKGATNWLAKRGYGPKGERLSND